MTKKDEIKLSKFDVIEFLDDGETVIWFLRTAITEGDEDCIIKAIKDVGRAFDKVIEENKRLKKKLEIATKALNRICEICTLNTKQPLYIAQFTNRKVKVSLKEMEGVK